MTFSAQELIVSIDFNYPEHSARVNEKLNHILKNQESIMADLTALNAAIGDLNTEVAAVQTFIGTLTSGDDQAGVDAATASVTAANASLAALVPVAAAPVPPADGTEPPAAS